MLSSKSRLIGLRRHMFEEGELDEKSVVRKFRTDAADEKTTIQLIIILKSFEGLWKVHQETYNSVFVLIVLQFVQQHIPHV